MPGSLKLRPRVPAWLLLALWVVGFAPRLAAGEVAPSAFDAANKLYFEGKYPEAAAAFEQIAQSSEASPAVYFNLGNAYFKANRIGRAIAAYRRAAEFAPRDPDIRANLQFARNQVQGPTWVASRSERWLARLTLNEWTFLAMAAFWLWLLLLVLQQVRPAWKAGLRNFVWASLGTLVLVAGCLGAAVAQQRLTTVAVVAQPETNVRTGPFDDAAKSFSLSDGAEVEVTDAKGEWLQVSPDPQRIGWVRKSALLFVR